MPRCPTCSDRRWIGGRNGHRCPDCSRSALDNQSASDARWRYNQCAVAYMREPERKLENLKTAIHGCLPFFTIEEITEFSDILDADEVRRIARTVNMERLF